jgi:alkyl hydroperoxide reductase subunit D
MGILDSIRAALPESARDLDLNLRSVLASGGSLTPAQRWGVAIASAIASRSPALRDALIVEARREVERAVVVDAEAAASLMAMSNVYYRFRHMSGKPGYSELPARLRMSRLAQPASDRTDFELFCLAVSAVNGCEACIVAHEKAVRDGGLSEEQVHDAVRTAAVVCGVAIALETGTELGEAPASALSPPLM